MFVFKTKEQKMKVVAEENDGIFQYYAETLLEKIQTQRQSPCLPCPISFFHKIEK